MGEELFIVGTLLLIILNIWVFAMVRSSAAKWIILGVSLLLVAAGFKWMFLPAWIRSI